MEYRVPALFLFCFVLFFYFLSRSRCKRNKTEWNGPSCLRVPGNWKDFWNSSPKSDSSWNAISSWPLRFDIFLHHFILFFPTSRRPSLKDITFNVIAPAPYRTSAQSWGREGGIKKSIRTTHCRGSMNNNPKNLFFFPFDKNQFLKKYFPVKKFCRAKIFFFSPGKTDGFIDSHHHLCRVVVKIKKGASCCCSCTSRPSHTHTHTNSGGVGLGME